MNFKGGSLRGAKYGSLSPLDYAGLKFWCRGTDGVVYLRGNTIRQWNDLSGNGNFLGGQSYVANTVYGPVIKAGASGGTSLQMLNTVPLLNFLGNGSPFTAMFVSAAGTTLSTLNSQATYGQFSAGYPVAGNSTLQISRAANGGNQASNFLILNAGTGPSTGFLAPATTVARPANLYDITHYGTAGTPYKMVSKANTNLMRRWSVYSTPPDPNQQMNNLFLSLPQGTFNTFHEIIIYDHTGKSQTQIDFEMANISELYIRKRYLGIY